VTAYLYRPEGLKEGERRPGVLSLQSTGVEGKVIVDGTGPKGPRLGFAAEMARRGWVVVAPDYPSFGEQKDYDFATSPFASGTMKAVCDNMRCVDLLVSLPEVDAAKIAAVGHSLGGHNALFTAVFDERIKVVVTSCGWTPFHEYFGGKKLANWAQTRYMPRVVSVYGADADRMPFDFAEVIAAIAPRAVWSNSPVGDENFDATGVRKGEAEARKVFALYGVPDRFVVTYPNYGHEFGEAERGQAWGFMESVWGRK
jgi:dienelactone hydrolase